MARDRRENDLTPSERNQVYQFLFTNSVNGRIKAGKLQECSSSYGVHKRTLQYLWTAAKAQQQTNGYVHFGAGKKGILHMKATNVSLNIEQLKAIPFHKRTTIRRLARELELSKSTVGRWIKRGDILPHTNAIKPTLTDKNKLQRLKYCLSEVKVDNINNNYKFKLMHNVIHIDEKWFYMTKAMEITYKAIDEIEEHRSCKSKRYIPKVMFMCAITRPQYNEDGSLIFDGKIGIFPFTFKEAAKRNSKHRVKGTLETKPIKSINKNVIKTCLIEKIIPAIKSKWPANFSKEIYIQQDNAKPHINNNDPDFRMVASSDVFNINLSCQPPNSPDTNINDLGWFRAIQSLQTETSAYNVDQLVTAVFASYESLTHVTLNKVFVTLQSCMIEIMKQKGHNNYKIPHIGKDAMIREQRLPLVLEIDDDLIKECIDHLTERGDFEGVSGLMIEMGCD